MKVVSSVDYGGYYFFRFVAQQHPELVPVMQIGDALGTYVVFLALALLTISILIVSGRSRGALFSMAIFALGAIFVEIVRTALGERRPEDAQALVGVEDMLGSFPARGVFLFTLGAGLVCLAARGLVSSRAGRVAIEGAAIMLVVWLSLSQLFLGLHFVTDVVAGLAGGLGLALLASPFLGTPAKAPVG